VNAFPLLVRLFDSDEPQRAARRRLPTKEMLDDLFDGSLAILSAKSGCLRKSPY